MTKYFHDPQVSLSWKSYRPPPVNLFQICDSHAPTHFCNLHFYFLEWRNWIELHIKVRLTCWFCFVSVSCGLRFVIPARQQAACVKPAQSFCAARYDLCPVPRCADPHIKSVQNSLPKLVASMMTAVIAICMSTTINPCHTDNIRDNFHKLFNWPDHHLSQPH